MGVEGVQPRVEVGSEGRFMRRVGSDTSGWRRPLLLALGIVVGLRLLLSAWAALVLTLEPAVGLNEQYDHVGVPLQQGGLAAPWQREDAMWYEKIATQGYQPTDGSTAFFPLLPVLMRVLSFITLGNTALAGILVSSIAAVAALTLLYRLAELDGGLGVGTRALVYMALFPTAFFLYSAFTESLFLALAIGAFWSARHGRWAVVALLAGLAGLTKMQGALLCIPLAVEYLLWARGQVSPLWRRAVGVIPIALAGPVATLAFFAYTGRIIGDPLSWSERVTSTWQQRLTWPGEPVLAAFQKLNGDANAFDLVTFLVFATLALFSFRLRPSYGLQAATVLIPSMLRLNEQFPLMSMSRYVLAAFPCFIVLALWAGNRPPIIHRLIVSLGLILMLYWANRFVHGFWVA